MKVAIEVMVVEAEDTRRQESAVVAPDSVAKTLHRERLRAHLSTKELALRAGLDSSEVAALDAGRPAGVLSAAEFLVHLDRLSGALGLPRGALAEETLATWAAAFADTMGEGVGEPPVTRELGTATTLLVQPPPAPSRISRRARVPVRRVPSAPRRRLCVALVVVAVLLAASSVTLGLAEAGVIRDGPAKVPATVTSGPTLGRPATHPGSSSSPGAPLVLVSSGPNSATYESHRPALTFSLVASRPSWVELRTGNGPPLLAATLTAGTAGPFTADVPFSVEIGAGGTTLVASGAQGHQILSLPSAPFTFFVTAARP